MSHTSAKDVSNLGLGGNPGAKNHFSQSKDCKVEEALSSEEKNLISVSLNSKESRVLRAKV